MTLRLLCWGIVLGLSAPGVRSAEPISAIDIEFASGLRRQSMAPLAVEFLREARRRPVEPSSLAADLDFEWGAALLAASESTSDLTDREKNLEEARSAFETFRRQHPDHPQAVDAMVQEAGIELGRGRLRILQAQLPANESRAVALAEEGRALLAKAGQSYVAANERITRELDTLTGFLDPQKDRPAFRRRERLFEEQVESKFQSGLALFLQADSFATIDDRLGDPRARKEYVAALRQGLAIFQKLSEDYRRELVGLYGSLWSARCLTALGEHKKADAILENLLGHENRELEKFQREAFHFRLVSLAAQGDFAQVDRLADGWLKENNSRRREPAYQGVQWITARSLLQLAEQQKEEKERERLFRQADDLLGSLARSRGTYSAQASREQLTLARRRNRMLKGNTFLSLSAEGMARLDEIAADAPEDQKKAQRAEGIAKLEQALAKVDARDAMEDVSEAKYRLVFAYYEAGEDEKAIALAESMTRAEPEIPRATDAALLALSAYARSIDRGREASAAGGSSPSSSDLTSRLPSLAEVILKRWPKSATADQTRLLMAKLALMGERWDEVVSLASAVASDPSLQAQGTALAGIARWREVNRLAEDVPSRAEKLSQAVAFLRQSSKVWADVPSTTPAGLTPDRWRMEIVRGEVELAAGSADQATSVVEVLTRALEDQEHRPTDPALLASAVAVVMRIRLAQGKVDDAKAFFASVSPLLEKGESKGVTGALLTLVRSVRASQSPSSGPSVRPSVEIKGLETLLDEVSQRQQDLSPREKLYLVDAYLAAGNGAKALALVDPLLPNLPAAEQVTPRLLRAKALSLTNRHEEALADITQLLRENVGVKEVIVARGEILESAGDGVAAIKHWQWYLDRLKRVEPRPAELYEVTDRICGLALSVGVAAPETKKVLAGSLRLPIYLLETDPNMPAEWKNRLSRRVDEIKRRLAGGSSS